MVHPMAGIRRLWICAEIALLGLLSSLDHSFQLHFNHPLREVVDKVNGHGPFVGLVMAYSAEEDALRDSGFFVSSSQLPSIDLSGRRFHVGIIWGVNIIYVMSGQRRLNAGITVQILLDVFDIQGIVHYGTAGSANDSLSFGDVSVPRFVAFTGSWKWMKFNESEEEQLTELEFASYNYPEEGESLLGSIEFKPEEFLSVNRSIEEVFWLEINTAWFQAAGQLEYARKTSSNHL